jgi:predicted DCC family thiol-disulfide oxidoreductase YuxK
LILFDGVCGLCNKFVQYVLNHDPKGRFRFASLQSELAHEILGRHGKDPTLLKTIYLIRNPGRPDEKVFTKSAAALRIIGELNSAARGLKLFLAVPAPIRDLGYDLVAAVRYQVFGKHDVCPMPTAADRERFLDI